MAHSPKMADRLSICLLTLQQHAADQHGAYSEQPAGGARLIYKYSSSVRALGSQHITKITYLRGLEAGSLHTWMDNDRVTASTRRRHVVYFGYW